MNYEIFGMMLAIPFGIIGWAILARGALCGRKLNVLESIIMLTSLGVSAFGIGLWW